MPRACDDDPTDSTSVGESGHLHEREFYRKVWTGLVGPEGVLKGHPTARLLYLDLIVLAYAKGSRGRRAGEFLVRVKAVAENIGIRPSKSGLQRTRKQFAFLRDVGLISYQRQGELIEGRVADYLVLRRLTGPHRPVTPEPSDHPVEW